MMLPPTLDGRPLGATYNPRHFNAAMKLATEGRAFLKTRDGYMGMGPSSMLPGDEVCILQSGQTHMVLRYASRMEHESYAAFKRRMQQYHSGDPYNLIGDCYLYTEDPEVLGNTWRLCSPTVQTDLLQRPDPKPSLEDEPQMRRRRRFSWVVLI